MDLLSLYKQKIGEKIKISKHYKIFIGFSVVFFLLTSMLYWTRGPIFNSPDENATFFFVRLFVETGNFAVLENRNVELEGWLHPRSVMPWGEKLVPVGFLGTFLILGFFGKIIGTKLIFLLIPLFSAVIPFFYYEVIRKFFSKKIAFWSTLLFYLHPAFLYYSSRNFLPNVLFLNSLILGTFLFLAVKKKFSLQKNLSLYFFSGLSFGTAVMVRPSEFLWVGFFILSLLVFRKSFYTFKLLFSWFFGILLMLGVFFFFNHKVYGHPLSTGYIQFNKPVIPEELLIAKKEANFTTEKPGVAEEQTEEITEIVEEPVPETQSGLKEKLMKFIFPFGIDLHVALNNVYAFSLYAFPWLSIPVILGMIVFLKEFKKKYKEKHKNYFIVLAVISLYMFLYYGSWSFSDNINGNITIGNSYVRYWLIPFIMSLPFGAIFFLKFFKEKFLYFFIAIIFILGSLITFFRGEESVLAVYNETKTYKESREIVFDLTDKKAIIISERSDKLFFPERQVISLPQKNYEDIVWVVEKLVLKNNPVFFYTEMSQHDIKFLEKKYFDKIAIEINNVGKINEKFSLWEFSFK